VARRKEKKRKSQTVFLPLKGGKKFWTARKKKKKKGEREKKICIWGLALITKKTMGLMKKGKKKKSTEGEPLEKGRERPECVGILNKSGERGAAGPEGRERKKKKKKQSRATNPARAKKKNLTHEKKKK